jgi:hypothetical protein
MSRSDSSFRAAVEGTVRRLSRARDGDGLLPPLMGAAAAAGGARIASAVQRWVRSRRPTLRRLARGAAAGAGAAGIVTAARVLLNRRGTPGAPGSSAEIVDELLAGAGRGVLYAAVLDPILPGPPPLRGALAGAADYLLSPWGGLFSLLQSLSPVAKIPVVSVLLEMGEAEDDPFLAFFLFGLALGILTGDPEG